VKNVQWGSTILRTKHLYWAVEKFADRLDFGVVAMDAVLTLAMNVL
jgi:hypothetical protein